MTLTALLSLLMLLWTGPLPSGPDTLSGTIYDAETLRPLHGAHIKGPNQQYATSSGTDGSFALVRPDCPCRILITMTGYKSREMDPALFTGTPVAVYLEPRTGLLSEVVIRSAPVPDASPRSYTNSSLESTEQFMQRLNGLSMIKRANYAWEPSLRGMSDSRVNVLIDGVTMVSACVDRMDPVTSYVETENLEKVDVSMGNISFENGNRPGGSVNLITARPGFDAGYYGEFDAGYQHNGNVQKYRVMSGYSNHRNALQVAFTLRDAGNFTAGGGERLGLSGYTKMNLKVDAGRDFAGGSRGWLTWIGDLALDAGYPALIMDTDKARSHLISYEHEWRNPGSLVSVLRVKPYHTRVDHWMSDYNRDVTTRDVMPGMYMPMFGKTRTTGIRLESTLISGRHLVRATMNLHRLDAFADMLMEPVDEQVSPMYLINIGDAVLNNAYVSADHSWLMSPAWSLNTGLALDLSGRTLNDPVAADLLTIEFPDASTGRLIAAANLKAGLQYQSDEAWGISLNMSGGSRLPSHIESYGYYIYNPLDDLFYFGNPGLKNEQSTQVNLSGYLNGDNRIYGLEASLFVNHIRNYIGGRATGDLFAAYTNYDAALYAGVEAAGYLNPWPSLGLTFGLARVYAQNLHLDEPLPMIPPLEAQFGLEWKVSLLTLAAQVRHAAAQRRIASATTLETPSEAFTVIGVRGTWNLHPNFQLRAEIENIADARYTEHTSPGNFPSPGRNAQIQILIRF
ncbi:MAG: TonB-dependent receptor [Cyclonatronaceae bacterium]